MSYTTGTVGTLSTINYTYGFDEIFNKVCLISAYMTKNIKNGDVSAMDDYSLTDDEKDMFFACLVSSMPDTWSRVLKITSGVESGGDGAAYDINEQATGVTAVVTIKIRNYLAYNDNTKKLVDASMKNCVIYGVLRDFYAGCYHPALLQISEDRYAAELAKLERRLFQLKKKKTLA